MRRSSGDRSRFSSADRGFDQRGIITGGALDQPSLTKGYFIFSVSSVIFGLVVCAVRWIGDRRRRSVRWTLLGLSLVAFLQPLSVLTITFYDLIRYIHAMGFTRARIDGLVFGVSGYAAVFVFIGWACGMLRLWPGKLRWTCHARGFEVSSVREAR